MVNQMDRESFEFNKRSVAASEAIAKELMQIRKALEGLLDIAEMYQERDGLHG